MPMLELLILPEIIAESKPALVQAAARRGVELEGLDRSIG